MKLFKLQSHQKDYSKDELIISQKDYPTLKIGDVIEIYAPEDEFSRLLMQVKSFDENPRSEPLNKENPRISIEQTVVNTFQLRNYGDVVVNVVNTNDVILDSVELFFKDQYLARSDMWRLKRHVFDSCVYLGKKIEFCNIRCQVFELWSQGERVASGYVNEDTKIVYRSASSMVYLFIQMSSEMWDYDINGDLYFEKAVNGFLSDLFDKWKRFNCSHDVTIVLFSRTFYDAYSIDDFPPKMRECLQTDYKGRFYEDFYRVAVQNDRHDDWSPILILLRKLFNQYENEVIRYHEKRGLKVPKAYNSTSSQGNFLEVLNMSLNVFEKHHLYRSFDRTGQLSVVISPGVGVFEVDLDLTNITKQRIIDNGIGSDLVCLGEQPLHAVPLFKFNAKANFSTNFSTTNNSDVQYNMPHWINLSFYSSSKQINYSNFVPRIKLPNFLSKPDKIVKPNIRAQLYRSPSRDSATQLKTCRNIPSFVDYDEYDGQIFKVPSSTSPPTSSSNQHTCQPSMRRKSIISSQFVKQMEISDKNYKQFNRNNADTNFPEENNFLNTPPNSPLNSESIDISLVRTHLSPFYSNIPLMSTSVENKSIKDFRSKPESKDDLIVHGYSTTYGGTFLKSKALINPFDPSHVTIKLTSNRRRWTHVFPLGPTGIFMQQHHYQAVPQNTACTLLPSAACADSSLTFNAGDNKDKLDSQACRKISIMQMKLSEHPWLPNERKLSYKAVSNNLHQPFANDNFLSNKSITRTASVVNSNSNEISKNLSLHSDKSLLWAWGATGEQEWTPAITTGVDWKSMVMPACLPITTDFLPDKRTLQQDYVTYSYNLLPEDQSADLLQQRCYRGEEDIKNHTPLTTFQVYLELICQRLQQGFQIILLPNSGTTVKNNRRDKESHEHAMSIGRIFHELKLEERTIYVTNYHPRHPYPVLEMHYCYRFRSPDNEKYGVSWCDFTSEKLETYKWNFLDNYICMRGDHEYQLEDSLKYWRFRLLMLPTMHTITKTIIEKFLSGENDFCCDLYHDFTTTEKYQLQEGFIKFMEIINRIRRPIVKNKTNAKYETRKPLNLHALNRRFSVGHFFSQNTLNSQISRLSQPTENLKNDLCDTHFIKESLDNNNVIKQSNYKLNIKDKSCDEVDGNSVSSCKPIVNESESNQNEETLDLMETSKKLNITQYSEIIDALKEESSLNFLTKQCGLPPMTFISAEAVLWAKNNIENVLTERIAITLFQSLLESGYICHASGDKSQPFKHGFYLYCIIDSNSSNNLFHTASDIQMFEKEWMEVMIVPQNSLAQNFEEWYATADELYSTGLTSEVQDFTFKSTTLDLEDGSKNGRVEWVDIKHHSVYDPEQAFEIAIEWMVSTGNAIAEIVHGWSRKTTSTGLHLVPIPFDPFALPFSSKSDPLRGPIYISLNIDCLPRIATPILKGGLINFQEKILVKFGFIPFHDSTNDNQMQYVHVSGSIFVMILGKTPSSNLYKSLRKRGKLLKNENEMVSNDIEELSNYITRHFSGVKQAGESSRIDTKTGFLWCWNYMITKRWKTGVTGDESSMRKIYQDFRSFCSNKNERLVQFWENFNLSEINEDNMSTDLVL